MELDLVLDIGNSLIKAGLFEDRKLVGTFLAASHPVSKDELLGYFKGKPISKALISSVNAKADEEVKAVLGEQKITYTFLDPSKLKLILDVDEPGQVGADRIANAYGALTRFPINDAIIIDIGTAITGDLVAKEGRYLGGMIYPGAGLCAKALANYTDKLPLVTLKKPSSALGKTTETHLQAGIYYGQLGAIERIIAELKLTALAPSSIKIIATGGATRSEEFTQDLKELVDLIDPHLTLVGLHEILIELTKKE
jgi:type III pantothenate kinase